MENRRNVDISNSNALSHIEELDMTANTLKTAEKPIERADDDGKRCSSRYSYRQWAVLLLISETFVFEGMSYTIQAPFYPKLASSKGVSSSVYGLVFGVFELVNFIVCPICGRYITKIGAKLMLNVGNYVLATCCILFGFLDKVPAGTPFVALSFILRIVEAIGQAAYVTSAYAIVVHEFPDNVATTLSILETIYGVGMIVGPATGGFLYELGGYLAPFAAIGSALLVSSLLTTFFMQKIEKAPGKPSGLFKLLRIPAIAISYYVAITVAFGLGFTITLLEPHLRQFDLSMSVKGLIFMINGGTYALSVIAWGYIADRGVNPKLLCTAAGAIIAMSFTLMGPAPFLPFTQELWLLICSLVLHGLGIGGGYLGPFLDSTQEAISHGYPNDIETYGLVSGFWFSGVCLGSFLGSSVSGILNDHIGFRYSAFVVVILNIFVVILTYGYYRYQNTQKRIISVEEDNVTASELLLKGLRQQKQ